MAVMTLEEFKKKKKDTEEAPRSSVMTLEEYKKATNYEPEIDDALFKNKSTLGNASSGTTKYNKLPTYNKISNGTNKYNKMEITKLPVKNNFQSQFNTQNNVTKTSGFNNKIQSENPLTNNVWYQKQQKEKTQKENRIKQLEKQLPDLQKKLNTSVYSDSKKAEWQQEYNKLQKEYNNLTKDTSIDLGKTLINIPITIGENTLKWTESRILDPLLQFSTSKANPYYWFNPDQLEEHQAIAKEIIATNGAENTMDFLGYNKEYKDGLSMRDYLEKNSGVKRDNFAGKLIGGLTQQGLDYIVANGNQKTVTGSMVVGSYGSGIEEAYQDNATRNEANLYGLLNAGIEYGTEKMSPNVNGIGIKDKGLKTLIRTFREEGREEVASDLLNPLAKKVTYKKDESLGDLYKDVNPFTSRGRKNLFESYTLGGTSALLMHGAEVMTDSPNVQNNINNQNINENTKLPITKEENLPKINKNYNTLEENNTQINENKANIQELPTKTINNTNLQEINQNREQNKQIAPIKTIENNNEIENTIQNTTETNNNNENIVENLKKIRENTTNKAEQVKLDNHIQQIENDIKGLSNDNKSFAQDNKTLEQRVSGDKLLDVQDLINELKEVGAKIDENGYVTLYHQTTPENAQKIKELGKMTSKEQDVFFSTSENASQADGRGTEKLEFKIPAEKLQLDDIFSDNADVKIPLKGQKELDVSSYIVNKQLEVSPKQQQFNIINETNPMQDDYHTGIRSVDDIKSFEEAFFEDGEYSGMDPDFTETMAQKALDDGKIIVYSSYPIENGVFVSPSKMEAQQYAGGDANKLYSKKVNINDVAWIDGAEGQYAKVQSNISIDNKNQSSIDLPKAENRTSTFSDNLMTFTENEKASILRSEKNVIVNNKQELKQYVLEAINDNQSNKNIYLGVIPKSTITNIVNKVTDISEQNRNELFANNKEYQLAVNQEEIRHLNKESLTENDVVNFIDSLDELIANFDTVRYTLYKGNQNGLRFKKNMSDGTHIAVEILSKQKGTMRTQTLFLDKADFIANKKRSIAPTLDELNSPSKTSEMDGGLTPSDNNTTTNQQKSQVAPVSLNNMQQNNKVDTENSKKSKITKKETKQIAPVKEKKEVKLPVKETKNSNLPLIKLDTAVKQIKYNQADYKQIADTINSKSNTNPRSWLETSMESKSLKEYQPELIKGLKDENLTYEVQSNKSTLEKANKKLSSMSYENAVSYIEGKIYDEKNMTLTDVALTERLIQEASKKGDYQTASNLIQDLAIMGTDMGQKVQALSMIKRLTPEGQLSMYQKIVNRAKARGEYAFNDVEITPEMVKTILDAYDQNGHYDQADLNERVEKFKQQVSEQLKSTVGDKLNSWRYLSMLGNPKTHIRNIVSNVAMKGTLKVKNSMARTLETVLPVKQENRTKTWKMATKDVKNYAKQTAIDMKDTITGENKYNEKTQLENNKKIFKSKVLEGISNFNSNALEFEDWLFSKSAFQKTFQEYLTAQGIKTQQDIENNPKIIEKGKQYAVEQAEIATFRQYSKLAAKIAEIERHNKGAKFAIEALVPFKKTPINVAKAGVNYSPLGLTKSVFYDSIQLKKGNINGSQFIDNLSQGMTGTSLALLGYALAKSGILSGAGDDDKEGKYDNQLGHQNYSLNLGGNSYSISWLSPVAMPLLVGANSYEKLEKQEGWDANVVIDTLASTLDPLSSMSFVSGLTDTLNSYSKGSSNMIKDIGLNTLESYILQYIPTLSSQFASVTDDKKRSTKASNNSKFKWGEELGRQIMYKIPGLRQQLEVSTDIWGNDKEQSNNIVERAFETFIAPYSKTKDISTDLDKEIKRIYGETGETGVIPGVPYGYTRYKNETYRMSAKEYTQYKKTYGQTANSYLDNLIKTDSYKKASYDLKAKMMDKMYDYARAKANEEYFKNTDVKYTSDNLKELNELKDVGITNKSFAEYIADKTQISNIRSSSNYSTEEKRDMVSKIFTSSKLNNKQLSYLYGKYYSTTEKLKALNSLNMPMKEFIKYDLKEFTSDYDSKGKMINGSKQKKVMNYINSLNLSVAQKALLIKLEYNSFKSYDSQIVSYINSSNGDFLDKAYLIKKLGYKSHDKEIIEYVFKHYKTASEREEILKSLGFTIRNGRVY